jgi:hypothetical protein
MKASNAVLNKPKHKDIKPNVYNAIVHPRMILLNSVVSMIKPPVNLNCE